MFYLSEAQLSELEVFTNSADKKTRVELARGIVGSENDYTSAFVNRLRLYINELSTTGLRCTAVKLTQRPEQVLGCDAAIILSSGEELKIATFEAKFPRFLKPKTPWDKVQETSLGSHFSHQIDRQALISDDIAKFEVFYSQYVLNSVEI